MGINLFRVLVAYLKPVLPETVIQAEAFLNIEPLTWPDIGTPLLNHNFGLLGAKNGNSPLLGASSQCGQMCCT